MKHVCFRLRLKKQKVEEYLHSHKVWPEMLEALGHAGIKNYSLFVHKKEGFIIGYFEAEDPQKTLRKVGQTEVNSRWQAHMAEFFESGSGDMQKSAIEWLDPYFYLP